MGNIVNLSKRRNEFLSELLLIWENSVRATHDFLSEEEIEELKPFVLKELKTIPSLLCIKNREVILGFMGVAEDKLEMLFVKDTERGKGFGKALLLHAIEKLKIRHIDVNEQNPNPLQFYKHFGFTILNRSEFDSQNKPRPILHLELTSR